MNAPAKIRIGLMHPTLRSLFRERVRVGGINECWPWQGFTKETGYGRFKLRTGATVAAHRLAYFLARGEWPGSLHVCHRCDNPPCCNPTHLFLGSHADNMADMEAKGRRSAPRGEKQHLAKLTVEQVRDMRLRYNRGRRGDGSAAAAEFGISRSAVSAILRRRTWQHVL